MLQSHCYSHIATFTVLLSQCCYSSIVIVLQSQCYSYSATVTVVQYTLLQSQCYSQIDVVRVQMSHVTMLQSTLYGPQKAPARLTRCVPQQLLVTQVVFPGSVHCLLPVPHATFVSLLCKNYSHRSSGHFYISWPSVQNLNTSASSNLLKCKIHTVTNPAPLPPSYQRVCIAVPMFLLLIKQIFILSIFAGLF